MGPPEGGEDGTEDGGEEEGNEEGGGGGGDWAGSQEPVLVQMLAAELGVEPTDIVDFECSLYDTQVTAVTWSLHGRYMFVTLLPPSHAGSSYY